MGLFNRAPRNDGAANPHASNLAADTHGTHGTHDTDGTHGALGGHGTNGAHEVPGSHGTLGGQGNHGMDAAHGTHGTHDTHGAHGAPGVPGTHGTLDGSGNHGMNAGHGTHGTHGAHDVSGSHGTHGNLDGHGTHATHDAHGTHGSNGTRGGLFGGHKEKSAASHGHHHGDAGGDGIMNRRPSFGQWLKVSWIDILTMVAMGLIGLGVYEAHPAASRSFPVTFADGQIVYPQFAYPIRKEVVPIWAAAMLGSLVPILFILLAQIRVKSFWDANNAIVGLLYSLITAAVFQVFLKWLIGGLRPHFLTACQPKIPENLVGNGFQNLMFDRSICTGDLNEIDDSLESFPSGHSTAAFAGFVFLSLYFNGKLKVFSNYHPAMWKLVLTYAPILAATLIAGALTIDEFHNWYDCLAGAIIGTMMAFSAYRMVYASVWDFRFNHIPLTRHTPFSFGAGSMGAGGFETAVWTHKAGWGHADGAIGGAPFDASPMRGGGAGGALGGMGGATGGTSSGVMGGGVGHHGHRASGSAGRNTVERKPVTGHPTGDNMV